MLKIDNLNEIKSFIEETRSLLSKGFGGRVDSEFILIADKYNLVPVFDWMEWEFKEQVLHHALEWSKTASLEDCLNANTVFIRSNRFVDGTVRSALKNGSIAAIIERLSDLIEG